MRPGTLSATIIGAILIDQATGAPKEKVVLPPGFYFPIEELPSRAKPAFGRVWIRHQNGHCYEVTRKVLTSLVEKPAARPVFASAA